MAILNLQNFAKIHNSDFDIKDITVLVGKPSTGKSYIMKILYGMNAAMGYNHPKNEISFDKLQKSIKNNDSKLIENIFKELPNLYKNILNSIFGSLNQINETFTLTLDDICLNYKNSKLEIKYTNTKPLILSTNNIFVETPLILEFIKFIDKTPNKTPYHIESLMNILKTDYSFTDEGQDKFIEDFRKKSQEIIKGDIYANGDSFSFKTKDKTYDIINASSGIKSIGLLQYLVTNKALKKDSILFWEEPEVHLHPTWQLKMVDLFVELMNSGIKVVFSTHSPYMADYLNAKAQREKFGDRISFNLLDEKNGIVKNTILDENSWDLLQDELLGSLEDIMWQYL